MKRLSPQEITYNKNKLRGHIVLLYWGLITQRDVTSEYKHII